MSLGSKRALILLRKHLHKFGVEIALWHHHPSMKICKLGNENLMEDEYPLLLTCSPYKVIHEKYDYLLEGHDNIRIILNGEHIFLCMIFT